MHLEFGHNDVCNCLSSMCFDINFVFNVFNKLSQSMSNTTVDNCEIASLIKIGPGLKKNVYLTVH